MSESAKSGACLRAKSKWKLALKSKVKLAQLAVSAPAAMLE
jgi:hypothetical protein